MEETADLLPFWEYSAVNDDRTRPTHRALDGVILPADSEFWNEHFPPWGFNCRCTVIARLDVPDDYNPEKPNSDTTLAYDENGVPVKAEYLTNVHDLSAGKFVGVPKQNSGLRETIETAAKEAKSRRSDTDFDAIERELEKAHLEDLRKMSRSDRNYKPPKQILESAREFQNRKSPVEVLHIFDENGKFVDEIVGTEDEVITPDNLKARVNGGSTIHWHPPEGKLNFESFSTADIVIAVEENDVETFVVTGRYLYSMRPPNATWTIELLDRILKDYERYEPQFERKLRQYILSNELSIEEAEDLGRHLVWKKIAKKHGLRYKRIEL